MKSDDSSIKYQAMLAQALSAVSAIDPKEGFDGRKAWISLDPSERSYAVSDPYNFYEAKAELLDLDKFVSGNFSAKTIDKFLESEILKIKKGELEAPVSIDEFFKSFHKMPKKTWTVTAPVSGICLDHHSIFSISIFTFGSAEDVDGLITNDPEGMYVQLVVPDVYDPEIAIERADIALADLARLIVFLSGKQDRSLVIQYGLPYLPSFMGKMMYVSTSSFTLTDKEKTSHTGSISNRLARMVPIDDPHFAQNEVYSRLWDIYARKHKREPLSDMEKRILSSALSLGESERTADAKNSIIYTCIALETVFSYDERDLFQKSIGDKLGDMFAFLIGIDKQTRLEAIGMVKRVYRMRSAIVHGGDKKASAENKLLNFLLRKVLGDLLILDAFKDLKGIEDLNELLRSAQLSYEVHR